MDRRSLLPKTAKAWVIKMTNEELSILEALYKHHIRDKKTGKAFLLSPSVPPLIAVSFSFEGSQYLELYHQSSLLRDRTDLRYSAVIAVIVIILSEFKY
jgi:hypothetical protein